MIWAAELHRYKDKYYYFATFTNRSVKIDTVAGNIIERRASHVLVSNKPDSPYVPMQDPIYLPAHMPTLDSKEHPNKVTDGPYLFRTKTGRLGMIWTSWVYDVYTQGVAYSQSGTLDGPWIHEKDPITPPNFGHGMLFTTLEGKLLMSVHSHKNVNGRYVHVPHLFEADLSGDKMVIGKLYLE